MNERVMRTHKNVRKTNSLINLGCLPRPTPNRAKENKKFSAAVFEAKNKGIEDLCSA